MIALIQLRTFYEEYRSVCDMTAEFYLQTVEQVFQNHCLPRGVFKHRDMVVDIKSDNGCRPPGC